jgi:putative redox protein
LVADEGPRLEGADAGPDPFELLLSSLGACTAITLRMYAARKAWPLASVDVRLAWRGEPGVPPLIERELAFDGPLDQAQRARLADIAERTPVTLVLKSAAEIRTTLA